MTTDLNALAAFAGYRIVEDQTLVESYEDWSRVRSRSRAIRRRRYGHRQNVEIKFSPSAKVYSLNGRTLIMHPATAAALRARASEAQHKERE